MLYVSRYGFMARAGQQVVRDKARPEDFVSKGVLAKVFPRHAIDGVVEATCVHEKCQRLLPTWLVVYYVLGHALFMDLGGGRLISKLVGTLAWKGRARGSQYPFPTGQLATPSHADSRYRNQTGKPAVDIINGLSTPLKKQENGRN